MGNAMLNAYARGEEFRAKILPYVIKEVGGVKIAFIGLVTYEFIYDGFLRVGVTSPAPPGGLAAELKPRVDAVVVISHNSIGLNREILEKAPTSIS